MIGRRSPLEVSFSVKEFRRLVRLPQCHTIIGFEDVEKYKAMIGGTISNIYSGVGRCFQ